MKKKKNRQKNEKKMFEAKVPHTRRNFMDMAAVVYELLKDVPVAELFRIKNVSREIMSLFGHRLGVTDMNCLAPVVFVRNYLLNKHRVSGAQPKFKSLLTARFGEKENPKKELFWKRIMSMQGYDQEKRNDIFSMVEDFMLENENVGPMNKKETRNMARLILETSTGEYNILEIENAIREVSREHTAQKFVECAEEAIRYLSKNADTITGQETPTELCAKGRFEFKGLKFLLRVEAVKRALQVRSKQDNDDIDPEVDIQETLASLSPDNPWLPYVKTPEEETGQKVNLMSVPALL